jgi:hypothetical protein
MCSERVAPTQSSLGGPPSAPMRRLTAAAMLMPLFAALLAPALWNGFPLIFADTGGYLARPFERTLELGRSTTYGAFLAAGLPLDFWPIVLVQAAVTAWVLALVLRVLLPNLGRAGLVAIVLLLTVATSLPWYASQLMPDIFVLLAAIAVHMLAFRPRQLAKSEMVGLAAVLAFAIASHLTALALALAQLCAFAVLIPLARSISLPSPKLTPAALAVSAGIMLALASNVAVAGKLGLTPGGSTFLFARLAQDGIAKRYLDDHCRHSGLRLCSVRNEITMPAEDWLWAGDSPLYRLGGWQPLEAEVNQIILETLWLYPGAHLAAAIRNTAAQLVTLSTGEGFNSTHNWHAEDVLSALAPHVMPRFQSAEQQQDGFDFRTINLLQVPAALLATALLPIVAIALRRRRPQVAAFALSALIALVANAAICGNFSTPNPRYQSRMAPLAMLAVLIAAAAARRGGLSRDDESWLQPDVTPPSPHPQAA